ncbi:MAG TPA: aspartate aminotransferase family protein [Clostridiaceae bacterium]|nr:aspartate aminotransferase family protein [Clostridiaceae bacterium]
MVKITSKTNDIIEKEAKYLSYTTRVPYFPLVVDKAKGVYVTDIEGNEFIDFLSSAAVLNTGHNHPKVEEVVIEQAHKFLHYTPAYMYHQPHTELAEKLIEITPGNFDKRVAFAISGSVAAEGAVKAAKAYTRRNHIVSFMRSYHGTTYGSLSVSGYSSQMRRNQGTLMPDVHFVPYPDNYRCSLNDTNSYCYQECLKHIRLLFETVVSPEEVAAIIFEPVQGDGGILVPEVEFFNELHKICAKHGILMIADEVQTGFGRTGKLFASERYDFVPDIIALGKAIASGMPLSAIVARAEIMESWGAPQFMFNTAGNVLSCRAALATIEIIEEENLVANAVTIGDYMINRFNHMKDKYECIGDVRGLGLLIGLDIVKDRSTKERDIEKTKKICWRSWETGLILAFFSSSVLRICPPLIITLEQAEHALDIIESAISDVEKGRVSDDVLQSIKGW